MSQYKDFFPHVAGTGLQGNWQTLWQGSSSNNLDVIPDEDGLYIIEHTRVSDGWVRSDLFTKIDGTLRHETYEDGMINIVNNTTVRSLGAATNNITKISRFV